VFIDFCARPKARNSVLLLATHGILLLQLILI